MPSSLYSEIKQRKPFATVEQEAAVSLARTAARLEHAAADVLHLHAIRATLEERLRREGRLELAEACFRFVPVRAELDLLGWEDEDIFAHS